jgi:hypothetical protein
MALLKITPFAGIAPRTGIRLLPNEGAQIASNLKLQSGELRPLNLPGDLYLPTSPKGANPLTIFRARTGATSKEWYSWLIDVDCVRVPLATDVESRFCWTGDGPPKMTTYASALVGAGVDNYPAVESELSLGIPTPQTAPTVTPSATGSASTVTRFYRYTFFSALGEESSPSPVSLSTDGKTDDTWALAALDEVPANSGVGTATATRFTNTALKHWLRVGDEVYFGGAPSTARTVTAIYSATAFDVTGASIAAETAWSRKTPWNTASMTKRVYRTTGTTGSWQLVNETGIAAATTTYNDTLTDALIAGDEMISEGWIPPPVGLRGLCVHPSGSLIGFVGNLLCASEPYQPHAWPEAYQLASGYNGVGVAVFGSSVVMATAGMPFVATGVEPASMTGEDVQGMYPCLSKRSVISGGDGVLYASLHGGVYVGAQGVRIFTDPWYTRDEWEVLNPETMQFATANGRIYVSYTTDDSDVKVLIFDGPLHTTVSATSVQPSTLYADVSDGELYIGGTEGIYLWDDGDKTVLSGQWRSKEFVFPAPVNLGAAKIDFDVAIDPALRTAILAAIATANAWNAIVETTLTPRTVTMTLANPAVFTLASHYFTEGTRIEFDTTGALPTSLAVDTAYFVITDGLTTDDFQVSDELGGTPVSTAALSQSGTHTVVNAGANLPSEVNMDEINAGDINGAVLYESTALSFIEVPDDPADNVVTFILRNGNTIKVSRSVTDTRAFRLPAGYKADNYSVEVITQCRVKEIRVSETMEGLRGA